MMRRLKGELLHPFMFSIAPRPAREGAAESKSGKRWSLPLRPFRL
jgi:hypothetical protein